MYRNSYITLTYCNPQVLIVNCFNNNTTVIIFTYINVFMDFVYKLN